MHPFPHKQVFVLVGSDGNVEEFLSPECGKKRLDLSPTGMKLQGNHIFLLRKNIENEEKVVQIVELPHSSNDSINEMCIPATDAYFGRQQVYIYKVEEGKILKRLLLTTDGKEVNPVVVGKTKNVCFSIIYGNIFNFRRLNVFVSIQIAL